MNKYITSQAYSEILADMERLRTERNQAVSNRRKETERADRECNRANALQIKVDAFDAIEEMEVAIHLSRGRYEN